MKFRISSLLFLTMGCSAINAQQKAFYRAPAIYDHWVVFTAEGDLWKHDLTTNQTARLTSHHGVESEAAFSPDGKSLVFAGEYEGATELYSIPADGGIPKRLTYENNRGLKPIKWMADGKILYTTRKYSALLNNQLSKLNPTDLTYELVPLSQAADGDFDSDKTLIFTRLSFQGSHTKRYKGGTAQSIWKFNGSSASTCLTCDYTGTSRQPMIYKDRIYFVSDRDGTMNIWSMDKQGKDLKQHTMSSGWDIQSPSSDQSKIVYQKGADLYIYDIDTNQEKMIDVRIYSDFDQRRPQWIKNPSDMISDWEVSPTGKFVALVARGRIFASPASGGRWVEVSKKSGARYKDVQFLDDKNIVYLSDESGEYEIWKTLSDGTGTPQRLTQNSKVMIMRITASPDGKWIAWTDKDQKLIVMNASTLTTRLIEQNDYSETSTLSWSADSKYFLYTATQDNLSDLLKAYDLTSGKTEKITSDRLNSNNAQTSIDSKWMYFVSEREFKSTTDSPWGPRQPEPYFDNTSKIFAIDLLGNQDFPFAQTDTWKDDKAKEEPKNNDPESASKKTAVKKPAPVTVPIDWPASAKRLYQLPLAGKNIVILRISETHLYWAEMEAGQWNSFKVYSTKIGYSKKQEPKLVAEGVSGFDLSSDRKKITVNKGDALYIADADGEKIDFDKAKIDLSQWSFQLNPVDDWKQMFTDAWRMERDYFYDRNLHGVDWLAMKKKYEPLVERVADRYDLDDLLAQMVSELSALHTFVYGGDKRKSPDNIQMGELGAVLERDPANNGYAIRHIYKSDPDYPEVQSPLDKPNLRIKEGDVILKIDGVSVSTPSHLTELLANKVGVPVKLSLKDSKGLSYDQLITPVSNSDEINLRISEWEYTRRLEVDQKAGSQIGYVHLRAMGSEDIADFTKNFYPVFNRAGLILDARHNGGGNIDSWILEKLMRKAWFYWQPRIGKPTWNMQYAFRGHIVVLCDEETGSDGEALTEGVRQLKLGTIIGTRTWGGEIWLSSGNRLVDNGIATAAETGVYDADGKWLIEGHGVDPDIIADNEPWESFRGKDNQLEVAIKFLQDKITKEPVTVPKAPPYPDKSFKYK